MCFVSGLKAPLNCVCVWRVWKGVLGGRKSGWLGDAPPVLRPPHAPPARLLGRAYWLCSTCKMWTKLPCVICHFWPEPVRTADAILSCFFSAAVTTEGPQWQSLVFTSWNATIPWRRRHEEETRLSCEPSDAWNGLLLRPTLEYPESGANTDWIPNT